jgi:hypothetical protein
LQDNSDCSIPKYYTADIGDYHLEPAPLQTNYLSVASNLVQGVWMTVTNVVDIDDDAAGRPLLS